MKDLKLPALTLLAAAALAAEFEPPQTFKASQILAASVVKGPHYTIAEEVKAEDFYQEFQIASDYGPIGAEGRTVLKTRLTEVGALAELTQVSKSEVFAKAAGGAVLNVGKSVTNVVKDPGGTAKGVGTGLKRMGGNIGRKSKQAAESVKEDEKADGSDKTTTDKVASGAGSAANSVLGVNHSSRKWAKKLGVDPYSTNPILHESLVDIGKIDAAGGIAAKVVVPIPAVVTTTASVGNLVWAVDPLELQKRNEATLTALGVSAEAAKKFFANRNYTPTTQTRLIAALSGVKAKGSADYVDTAAGAVDEREALFFTESAELLAGLHKSAPVTAILEDSRAMVARTGNAAVVLLPFDTVRWTERLAKAAPEIAGRAKAELGATTLEIRMIGQATAAARQGLGQAGWQLKEGYAEGLMVPPPK